VSPQILEAFGSSLEQMRRVWCAPQDSQPFIVAGSGTMAMEMAVTNLVDPGQSVLVVNTGYFSDRMTMMLRARGAEVSQVRAEPGRVPTSQDVEQALALGSFAAVFATHVDTSTGVRVDPKSICLAANDHGALSVFDGVCATVGERFEMEAWGADVYLTSSQKAIGLPCGLALMVVSRQAMHARGQLKTSVPLCLDWHQWLPIMEAYQDRRPSYFSTPATNLVAALDVGLKEILGQRLGQYRAMEACFRNHERVAGAMRSAWESMGLSLFPFSESIAANTLSAVLYPEGIGPELLGRIKARGVVVAGGLYPGRKGDYFRVGHMGYATTQDDMIVRTVQAIESALVESGLPVSGLGVAACREALG